MILYTTAPEAYDGFGTATIKHEGKIRKVKIQMTHYKWQTMRYKSGGYLVFSDSQEWKKLLKGDE